MSIGFFVVCVCFPGKPNSRRSGIHSVPFFALPRATTLRPQMWRPSDFDRIWLREREPVGCFPMFPGPLSRRRVDRVLCVWTCRFNSHSRGTRKGRNGFEALRTPKLIGACSPCCMRDAKRLGVGFWSAAINSNLFTEIEIR